MPWRAALPLSALLVALAAPATAQVVCRKNTLGAEVCMGLPAPSMRGRQADPRAGRGLSGVQARPQTDTAPRLVPARRVAPLGGVTILRSGDLPPRRPPLPGVAGTERCRPDALGNLVCG